VSSVRKAKKIVAPISTGRRPILSASMPLISDPNSTPRGKALKTTPSAGREMCSSWLMAEPT
jgi:hypothetical protein